MRPQPSFLSSRGYHFELTFPGYSELRFLPISSTDTDKRHVVYWHYTYRQIKTIDDQIKDQNSFFSDVTFFTQLPQKFRRQEILTFHLMLVVLICLYIQ